MKKAALIFLSFLSLLGCGDDVEFNTPAFQANKNYELWRATSFNSAPAVLGGISITAGINGEVMTFSLPSSSVNTYLFNTTSSSRAEFIDFEDTEYSTINLADPDVSLYPETGEVNITESTSGYISGTFRFIAYSADGLKSIGFNEGEFYRIPVTGGQVATEQPTCQQVTIALATASTNFSEVAQGDDQYTARCNEYRTALLAAIEFCGDSTGAFQAIIDGLGDCN